MPLPYISVTPFLQRFTLKKSLFLSNINPLPNDKFFDFTKLKAFADDKFKVAKMMIFLLDRAKKKLWENRFQQLFSKVVFFRVIKSRDRVVQN